MGGGGGGVSASILFRGRGAQKIKISRYQIFRGSHLCIHMYSHFHEYQIFRGSHLCIHMYSHFHEYENMISSPSLLPNHQSDMFYASYRLVFSYQPGALLNQPISCIFLNIEKANALLLKLAPKKTGAPNDSFLSDALKRYLRLSRVPIKLCRFILGSAIIFLSVRSF